MCHFGDLRLILRDKIIDYKGTLMFCESSSRS